MGIFILLICIIGIGFFGVLVGLSQAMAKMPPNSREDIGGMPYGISFKDDCNNDESWVG